MDQVLKAIVDKLPSKKLKLPLAGFREEWPYHVLMCNPSFKDVWNRLTYWDIYSSLSVIYRMNVTVLDIATIRSEVRELCAMNFFGLNTMRYQGFTEYKDNRLSSYENQLKHVMNPNEFVLWDEPVISMTDGIVRKTYNDAIDMIAKGSLNRNFIAENFNNLYGNSISIETDNGIVIHYAGLKRNSFLKYKIGESVKAGQVLGRVGCSGEIAKRPFLHIELGIRVGPETKVTNADRLNEVPLPILNFEPFYEMPMWTDYRDSKEGIERMYVKDIKYLFNQGHFLRAGSLVKKNSIK